MTFSGISLSFKEKIHDAMDHVQSGMSTAKTVVVSAGIATKKKVCSIAYAIFAIIAWPFHKIGSFIGSLCSRKITASPTVTESEVPVSDELLKTPKTKQEFKAQKAALIKEHKTALQKKEAEIQELQSVAHRQKAAEKTAITDCQKAQKAENEQRQAALKLAAEKEALNLQITELQLEKAQLNSQVESLKQELKEASDLATTLSQARVEESAKRKELQKK